MRKSILWLFFLLFLLRCSNHKGGTAKKERDPFYRQIEDSMPEMKANLNGDVKQAVGVASNQLTVDPFSGYLIASNRVDNSIKLYNRSGDRLLDTIGRKGRGPAEFLTISQLHVGYDHALYVLDGKLQRITKFTIENRKLQYVTTYTVKPKGNYSMRSIFVTKYSNYGVFHRIDNYETWEESFHLFKLNDQFTPVEDLLDISGNEKVKLAEHFYLNDYFGRTIYWDINRQWFYYISSLNSQVHMYNIHTGQLKKERYFILKKRTNTQKRIDFLKDYYSGLIKRYPAVADAIEEKEILPMFDNFQVKNNQMLFDVFYAGGKGGRIIYVHRNSGNVKYIKTQSDFWRFALGTDILYGIELTENNGPKIRILRLD